MTMAIQEPIQRQWLLFGLISIAVVWMLIGPDAEIVSEEVSHRGLEWQTRQLIEYTKVYRGNGGVYEQIDPFDAPIDEDPNGVKYGIKCCSEEEPEGPNWSKNPIGEEWCPFTYNFVPEECGLFEIMNLMNYHEGENFCAVKGGRLCTPREIENRCAVGNGCGFDLKMVWTNNKDKGAEAEAKVDTTDNTVALTETERHPLIHVFSPYHDPGAETFGPLNVDQWTMLVSATRSRDFFNSRPPHEKADLPFDSVIIVCAIIENDIESIKHVIEPYCDKIVILSRTAKDVYPRLKKLPFLQDLIDAGRSVADWDGEHLVMLTNADICPSKNFYYYAAYNYRETGSPAIALNRMTIPLEGQKLPKHTVHINKKTLPFTETDHMTLPESTEGATVERKHEMATNIMNQAQDAMDNKHDILKHPGVDCFMFDSSILDAISFGDLFLGYPRWGASAQAMLHIMAPNYHMYPSNRQGTFHIGDEASWAPENPKKIAIGKMTFYHDFDHEELQHLVFCYLATHVPQDMHTLQNIINCGKLFEPRDTPKGRVPSFIRPGHEDQYLQSDFLTRHPHFFEYTIDGFPISDSKDVKKNKPFKRQQWVRQYG